MTVTHTSPFRRAPQGRRSGRHGRLSPREFEIARLALGGMTNREIAGELSLSQRTVENTVARAMSKQHVASRLELNVEDPAPRHKIG